MDTLVALGMSTVVDNERHFVQVTVAWAEAWHLVETVEVEGCLTDYAPRLTWPYPMSWNWS